jgi:hypothetical protein
MQVAVGPAVPGKQAVSEIARHSRAYVTSRTINR